MIHYLKNTAVLFLLLIAGLPNSIHAQTSTISSAWSTLVQQYQVVSETKFAQLPYIVQANYDASTTHTDSQFFARGLTLPAGATVDVYHKQMNLLNPAFSDEDIQLIKIGSGMIAQAGDPCLIKITKASAAITPGDRIIIAADKNPMPAVAILANKTAIKIIGQLTDGDMKTGSVIILNYGSDQGAAVGQKLGLSKPRVNRGSARQSDSTGNVVILRTFARVSYAGIIQASGSVMILDRLNR